MTEENVVLFTGITKNDYDPDFVLEDARGKLQEVVIIGRDADGGEYFASSHADGGIALWHLVRAQHRLMDIVDQEIDGD